MTSMFSYDSLRNDILNLQGNMFWKKNPPTQNTN